nr:exopolysaccharide transport family protein [Iningainema tapete]
MNRGKLILASPQRRVNIKQISTILLKRRRIILTVSFVVLAVASILALIAKPTYQSSMQILVSSRIDEGKLNNQLFGSELGVVDNIDNDYTPQMKLMLSSMLIQKAVDSLRHEYSDITVDRIKGKGKKSAPLVITSVQEPPGENKILSQVLEVSFQDDDPLKVQKVLQALQNVYQKHNIEQQKQRLSKGISFINEQLPKVKSRLNQAQKNLEKFRKNNNLLDPEVQGRILLQSLADIRKQLQITRAQLQDLQARSSNLQQEIASSSQKAVFVSGLKPPNRYQMLLNEVQKTEVALAEERLRYTDDSPVVQKLLQQRQSQMALLQKVSLSPQDQLEINLDTPDFTITRELQSTSSENATVDRKLTEELVKLQTAVQGLRANEKSLSETEQQIRAELSKYPNLISQYNRLLPDVETHRKTLEQLNSAQQLLGIKIAQAGLNWQILEEPQRGTYLGSNRLLFLFGGGLMAPLVGILAALMWEMSHNTIYSTQDLQQLTNLRLLGTVPHCRRFGGKKRFLSLPWNGKSRKEESQDIYTSLPTHETLDMAYQNIQILTPQVSSKSLMLTSAVSGEGKSTVALGLADSAARMHQRVLVIDANMRSPHLHKILGLSNDWGLSLLLIEETNSSVQEYIQPIHPSIDVLTAGPTPEDTVKLLSSQRMKELLEFFAQTYDLVLIDAPPILGTVDGRILASLSQGIVMVARMGKVTASEVIQATDIVSKLNVMGILANEVSEPATV